MNRTHMTRTAVILGALSLSGLAGSPVVASAATSSTAAPAAGGGVSVRPVAHPGLDASKPFFDLHAAPGTTLREAATASNTGRDPVSLIVSSVDGVTGQTSGSVFANRQDPVAGAGGWVTPSVTGIELAPGASRVVPFTVQVPTDATTGDHLAGVAFENAKPSTSGGGFQITQVLRTVIGVLVVVPGPAVFHPELSSLDLATIGTTQLGSVTVGLGDDGQALGKPDLTVALAGPDGYRRSLTRTLDTVLPAAAIHYPFAWPDALPVGDYDITATLSGAGSSVTLTRHVRLDGALAGAAPGAVPAMPPVAATQFLSGYRLAAIIGAAVLVGLLGGWWLRRRPRRATGSAGP